ncbi:hypothetical protein [Microtetraspora niveoalba]|uniref:hypothetical protein n=1 Tax=Microtetraspora niveoalba TaxID=46175 RepID=UPI0008355DEA|nr:hypothetical protein [Microtetraspora niveoalba]
MKDITDRLRDATRAVGETIDQVPVFSVGESRTPSAGVSRTRRVWLIPIAAAASVAVAVTGGVAVARGGDGGLGRGVASAGPAAAPRFFAAAGDDGITIRSVDGGKETSRVPKPSDKERFVGIQAAQDNRLFYAVSAADDCRPRLYRFTLDDEGRAGGFEALPFAPPEGTMPTSLAVSGDGTKLAYGAVPCRGGAGAARLVVADTATGDSRTWTGKDGGDVSGLSMTADGRFVLFNRALPGATFVAEPTDGRASVVVPGEVTVTATELPSPAPTVVAIPGEVTASESTVPREPVPTADPSVAPTAAPEVAMTAEPALTLDPSAAPSATTTAPVPADDPSAAPEVAVTAGPVPVDDPSAAPSAVPSEGGTLEMASRCPMEPVIGVPEDALSAEPAREADAPGDAPAELHAVVSVCPDSPDLRLLDTGVPGDDLDQATAFPLPKQDGGPMRGVLGAEISPDGARVLVAFGEIKVEAVDGKSRVASGSAELIAYGTADGKPLGVVHHDSESSVVRLLDIDGTGENVLVSRGDEVGAVDAAGYRPLLKTGEPLLNFDSRIAW